jgi:hypothetical protein
MAKKYGLTKGYSGIFGQQVILKNRRGQIVMILPHVRPKVKPSEKQVAARERFKLAAVYARNAINDPGLMAMYAAKATKLVPAYQLAVNDFLKQPAIITVDISAYKGNKGNRITVTAINDFMLKSVTLKICDPGGTLIEEGPCVLTLPAGTYDYISTVPVTALKGVIILATAKDMPGNVALRAVTI